MQIADLDLTIVLPVFNEVGNVEEVVADLQAAVAPMVGSLQLVCVDDGSSDGTAQVLANEAKRWPNLCVVSHATNRGYGVAIRSGLGQASTRYVGWMDADGQYEASDVCVLFERLTIAGVAIAAGVRQQRADSLGRRLLGRVGSAVAGRIVGLRLPDADAGLKVFDSDKIAVTKLRSNGGYVSTELFCVGAESGVVMVPISHRSRATGAQTGASPTTLWGLILDFWRLRRAESSISTEVPL